MRRWRYRDATKPPRKPSLANYKTKARKLIVVLELAAQTLRDGLEDIEQSEENDK